MEDQMLGIATEIDTDEAFSPLNTLLFWYLSLLGLLVISMIAGLFLRLIRKGSSKPSIPLSKKYLVLAPMKWSAKI
jgi:hypothetical protein